MDFKQLVGLWYGGAALVLAHIVFGVSGLAVILCGTLMIAAVIVQLVLPYRSVRPDRQFVGVGARGFVVQLVLSAVLVAEWRACSGTHVANVAPSGALASPPGQTSTMVDDAINETASVVTGGAKGGARFTRNLPHQYAPASVRPGAAIPSGHMSRDKRRSEPSEEACQPSEDDQASDPHDGQAVGCARAADDRAGRVRQTRPAER
jgi:hypothetical protein